VPVAELRPVEKPKGDFHTTDRTYDTEGRTAISREMRRLTEELEEAKELGREDERARLLTEIQELLDAEKRDSSRRGKARRLNQTPEQRSADCVRKAIQTARKTIAEKMPRLAEHLEYVKQEEVVYFAYRPGEDLRRWAIGGLKNSAEA
jgi:hypothetical protein